MHEPLVSVMLPTYNQCDFARAAILSAAEQDYSNLEVVVSDDGSTDSTVDVILECARDYPGRVIPLVNQPHLGITANCNRNLKACRGKYIAFSAGDDLYLPGKIARQVQWLEEDEQRVLCGHDVEAFDSESGRRLYLYSEIVPLQAGSGAEAFMENCLFSGPSVMVRSSAMPPYGFEERLPLGSDWQLWIDCLAGGGKYGYVDGIYARYRRHGGNITGNRNVLLQRATDFLVSAAIIEASYPHLARFGKNFRTLGGLMLGKHYLLACQPRTARQYIARALWENPFSNWKLPLVLLLTFLPASVREAVLQRYSDIKPSDYKGSDER